MTFDHLAISFFTMAASSSGELVPGSTPAAAKRSRTSDWATAFLQFSVQAGNDVGRDARRAQLRGEHAPDDVGAAARRENVDDAHRSVGISLRGRELRRTEERGADQGQRDCITRMGGIHEGF